MLYPLSDHCIGDFAEAGDVRAKHQIARLTKFLGGFDKDVQGWHGHPTPKFLLDSLDVNDYKLIAIRLQRN